MVSGFILWFLMCCVNLCACCKCCRKKLPCCFAIFQNHQLRGKLTVIFLFVVAAAIATAAFQGRNEFNSAIYDSADELRALGDSFDNLYADAEAMETQSAAIVTSTAAAACDNAEVQSALDSTGVGLASAASSIEELLRGLGGQLTDTAKTIEDDAPPNIDLGLGVITCMVWLNVLLGICAILTDRCKCDDCLVLMIGSLTLLLLIALVGLEATLAVAISDFCFKGPSTSIALAMDEDLVNFYTTCNGTNPLDTQFDSAQASLTAYETTIDDIAADPAITCNEPELTEIPVQIDLTKASIFSMQSNSGCSFLNPRFTGFLNDIICDEAVRGLFLCLLVHGCSGLALLIAFCCFPCAANTEPRFNNVADMRKLFKALDTDGSGDITKEEMLAGAIELGMTKEEASALFDQLDTDGNGVVTQEELALMKNHKKHLVTLEKEKDELKKHLCGKNLGEFATKLYEHGIEQVADLSDPHLVDAQMLTDEIGMTNEQAAKCLAK